MQAVKAVLAGAAMIFCSGPAMAAVNQADLTLWGGSPRAVAEIGQPVTVGLAVSSLGPASARAVVLRVNGSGLDLTHSSDRRCIVRTSVAVCSLRDLAAGAQWSLTFTGTVRSSKVHLEASVQAANADPNFDNNSIRLDPVAGSLTVAPQRIVGRLPWYGGAGDTEVAAGVEFVNDTPIALSYQASVVPLPAPGVKGRDSWGTVTPAEGSVLENSSEGLKVVMSNLNLAPGLHRGVLRFSHDSPFTLDEVPVSFTVAYWDVPADNPAEAFVHALAGARIAEGCEDGNFCPQAPLTRATAAVWLLRAKEGASYLPDAPKGTFVDVPLDSPEAPFIEELARRGVTAGCGDGAFCPDQPICRAQLAAMVLRLLEGGSYTPPGARASFRGASPRHPLAAWHREAVRRSLMPACPVGGDDTCPGPSSSRAEAAVTIAKAFSVPLF